MAKTKAQADRASAVEAKLNELRELAVDDPQAAQDQAWDWISETGKRIHSDRTAATAELYELFRLGSPAVGIHGQTEGMLVGFVAQPILDRFFAEVTKLWMPWVGKKFDASSNEGINTLEQSAKLPARILWPFYGMGSESELGVEAFNFTTYTEPGALDPDREVLVIDYESVEDNPKLVIKQIRDELVGLVAGVHLGKMLWLRGGEKKPVLLAYFALKTPVDL